MFTVTIPAWIQSLLPALTWKVKTDRREVYITFDDGPHPLITPWVLEQLKVYNAKATFFCVGQNIEKFPLVYDQLIAAGHATGNHTYNHLNGWKTKNQDYFNNIERSNQLMKSGLFRPPYGRITFSQIRHLRKQYRLIMWDLLTLDYDVRVDPHQQCKKICDQISPGSIIVFHDSEKAEKNLRIMLPFILAYCNEQGFEMKSL